MTPTQLYHQYWRPLLYMATNIAGQQAEDIVADTFVKLIRYNPTFENEQKAKAWLYITTANSCREYLKKKKRENKKAKSLLQQEAEPSIEHRIIQAEVYHELWTAIQALPPQCQKIIRMKMEGMTCRQIADELGVALCGVKRQVVIGYQKLRLKTGPDGQ